MWQRDGAKPGSIYLPAGVPRSFTMWSRDAPQRQLDSRLALIILKKRERERERERDARGHSQAGIMDSR